MKFIMAHDISQISITDKRSKLSCSNSMNEFVVSTFDIPFHPSKARSFKEVICTPPNSPWVKGNCNGVFLIDTQKISCDGLFRDHKCDLNISFFYNRNHLSLHV